ncbi:hypothetical protein ON010_g12799 [Phytophthora cinnamomi]|nr:hypothetical protein ON010_g12799 [Phytophthora cinnamomi]
MQLHRSGPVGLTEARQARVDAAHRVPKLPGHERVCGDVVELHGEEPDPAPGEELDAVVPGLEQRLEALDDGRVEPRDAVLLVAARHDAVEVAVQHEFELLGALAHDLGGTRRRRDDVLATATAAAPVLAALRRAVHGQLRRRRRIILVLKCLLRERSIITREYEFKNVKMYEGSKQIEPSE